MNPRIVRRAALGLALALGVGVGGAAVRAWRGSGPPAATVGFGAEAQPRARAVLARLVAGLVSLQEADGGFALYAPADRPNPPDPEVLRTASSALAAWALVEAVRLDVRLPGADLRGARDRALDHLVQRQAPPPSDGALGRSPRNPLGAAPDRGPEVTALAAATAAWARRGDVRYGVPLSRAARVLGSEVRAGLRDGWMRGLVALSVDALLSAGAGLDLGPEPRSLLPLGEARSEPDCGDFRVAEAVVRMLRGEPERGDLYPEKVVGVCAEREPPTWSGQATDLGSWLMQAWLAARSLEARPWFARLLEPLDEALGSRAFVPGGNYADRVAQTACGVLAIAQGLRPEPVPSK